VNVLVVEDDSALSLMYKMVLTRAECEVTLVHNGQEAIDYLCNKIPDLIFLDIRLPIVNGVDVIHFMCELGINDQTYVVITSSSKEYESLMEYLPHSQFILKPILPAQILKIAQTLQANKK
jgi:CheY-like chemotaxis protein